MSLRQFHAVAITGWLLVLVTWLGARLTLGLPTSLDQGALWLLSGCVPIVVLLTIFRGAAPPTIAQVIYDTEQRRDRRVIDRIEE